MRILIFVFLILAGVVFGLVGFVRMEDKYPKGEYRQASCKLGDRTSQQNDQANRAHSLMLESIKKDHGVGIVAAVVIDGQLVWADAAGYGELQSRTPLSDGALMRIGSVSKPITAALAAKLHELGEIDIDAPIQQYLPEFPDRGTKITIRNLAAHLSGIRQYDFANFEESNSRIRFETLSEAAAIYIEDPLVSDPGEAVNYTSLGYNLIGAAVERATGKSFDAALQEYISIPMKLESFMVDDSDKNIPCRARFHTVYFGKFPMTTIWRDHSDAYPSAGILSTATDLAFFASEVFAGDFFATETVSLFTNEVYLNNGEGSNRSFGWEIFYDDNGSVSYFGHGGLTNGAVAELRYYPEEKLAFALITNYNVWLTDKAPQYQELYHRQFPELFGVSGFTTPLDVE